MRKKKAIVNVTFSLLQQIIAIICGFIVPKLIIKTYGSDVNGLISSITQFIAYITLLEAGIGPVVRSQLYKPIAKNDKNEIENILYSAEKYFRTIAFVFIIYIVVLLIFYPTLVNNDFSRVFSSSLILIISISSFAEYYFGITYRLFLHSDQKSYVISIIQSSTTILNTIIIVILALANTNILVLKLLSSLVFVLRPVLQYAYVKRKYNFNYKNVDKKYKLKNKWDGLAQHVAAIVHSNTDVAVLTIFTSVIQVSIYSVYYLVTNSLQKIIQSISDGIDASFGNLLAKGEKEKLRNSFEKYEILYYTLITIIYISAFSLIIPFVNAYTIGIKDANYVVPIFGMLIMLASYAYSIKIPYHTMVKTAGHFKQTQVGAWVEACINLLVSIILVFKLGLVGVAIGTFVATTVRTIELLIYSSSRILESSVIKSIQKILISIIEVTIFTVAYNIILKGVVFNSLIKFIIIAGVLFIITSIIILMINSLIIYRKKYKEIYIELTEKLKRKKHASPAS